MMNITKPGNSVQPLLITLAALLLAISASATQASIVQYKLENVIQTNGGKMTGTFLWDYTGVEFENGTGTFSELFIPGHGSDISALNISFDIDKSIEFSLNANLHNAGVDVTLFLLDPLTPTTSADIDTVRSKSSIGGGFNGSASSYGFLSGRIAPISSPVPVPAAAWLFGSAILGIAGFTGRKQSH